MNRLFTSIALLVATLVPAQAGLLDWAGGGTTTLSGSGARFTTSGSNGIDNISAGDIITGIFDFGTINSGQSNQRDIFGLMRAQVATDGTSLIRPGNGNQTLDFLLGGPGAAFKNQYDALTEAYGFADPTFAVFSSTAAKDISLADASETLLGLTPGSFELDLLAGDAGNSDLLSLASDKFLMGLTVTDTNGSVGGFTPFSYGDGTNSSELVTTNPTDSQPQWLGISDCQRSNIAIYRCSRAKLSGDPWFGWCSWVDNAAPPKVEKAAILPAQAG